MKIKPQDYLYMKDAITRVRDLIPTFRSRNAADLRVKDQDKKLRWDLAYYADLSQFFCSVIYKYADDSHIDTALRQIMREINQ